MSLGWPLAARAPNISTLTTPVVTLRMRIATADRCVAKLLLERNRGDDQHLPAARRDGLGNGRHIVAVVLIVPPDVVAMSDCDTAWIAILPVEIAASMILMVLMLLSP